MRYLPISSFMCLSCSPRFFESGKHWSYDHIKSPSKDTGMWKVWFGKVISLKSSGDPKVRLGSYIWTWKIILLDGCLTWLSSFTSSLLAWTSHLLTKGWAWHQALPSGNQPDLGALGALDQKVLLSLPPFSTSRHLIHALGLHFRLVFLLQRQLAQRPAVWLLAFFMFVVFKL